jgi:hypothetical protein
MFDIKAIEEEALAEVREEEAKVAKGQIKDSLKRIALAKTVLANAERDHAVLLRTIAG